MTLRQHTAKQYRSIRRILRGNPPLPEPEELREIQTHKLEPEYLKWLAIWLSVVFILCAGMNCAHAYTPEEYCQAIYKAEGGTHTKHPYGILAKYRHTSPKQACLNTVRHRMSLWRESGLKMPFTAYLGLSYCPIGASNDPSGLNRNWESNVSYFLRRDNAKTI